MHGQDVHAVMVAALLAFTTVGPAWAVRPIGRSGPQGAEAIQLNEVDRRIDVNRINMWLSNFGSLAYDIGTGNSGLYYPLGTDRTAVFASGLWFGGVVAGETRAVVSEFSWELGPGIILPGGAPDNPNRPEYKVYKVARYTGNPVDTAHVDRSGDQLAGPAVDPLLHHSWSEYMSGAAPYGAPWRIYRLPITDTSDPTDSLDVPGPDVLGDQMLWTVYNDAEPDLHTNSAGASLPLGLEVQQTTFGFDRPGPLGETVFLKFLIINKGGQQIDDMYVSLWSDPDLGGFTDDLVGVDTTLSLGYVYNSTNQDQIYGDAPPAVGYDFFLGPIDKTVMPPDTLFLASFNKYINGTDPADPQETYSYMLGLDKDGNPVIDPTTGEVTNFNVPGDPVLGSGWLDDRPADRRFLLTAGPFSMADGDTQQVVAAIIVGLGKNRLSSISALRFNDQQAQDAFNKNFDLPSAPAQPVVDVTVDHEQITLCWDSASRLNYDEEGYKFEGYNVYQGSSAAGPWTLIATYDEVNQVRVIYDQIFDFETGQIIPAYPVAFGSDLGVAYCHTETTDRILGGGLRDGTEYFYAVTAYAFSPSESPRVLENSQQVIRVIPGRPAAGTDPSTASALDVEYSQIDDTKPPATDVVSASVVDPAQVTGHTYKVGFITLPAPEFAQVGQDTATVIDGWFLLDVTRGDTLLKNQLNRRGDTDYRIVDGLQVKVTGAYFPKLQTVDYINAVGDHRRALTGVTWSGVQEWFFQGAGDFQLFFGASTIDPTVQPDSFSTMEIRFTDAASGQKAYRYLRLEQADGSPPSIGRSYLYGGFHDVPFQLWDTVNDVQLEAAFVERTVTDAAGTPLPADQQPATTNLTWGPDASDLGGREYLFSVRRPYSGIEDPFLGRDGVAVADPAEAPFLYALWSHLRDASDVIDPGDLIRYVWATPATPNDEYVFTTTPLVTGNAALAGQNLDRVRAVPNPYYNQSRYELNLFNRVIRFINLPETCTIRLFNLSGDLVRTLEKTEITTSVFDWDLLTDNQLPVGSGIYLYVIDAPGAGRTTGRLVVFMEQERINNF
jgi:hypothetical protein